MSSQTIYLSVSTGLWVRKRRLMWTELCQGKISLVSQGKARVLTLAQLFCISKDVRWERKWRVWNDDGPGTRWWDKHRQESRPPPPSSSSSCLVLIRSAMSQLLFPACPGIHLVPSVVHYFLQKPPESLQMSPAVWMPSVSLRTLSFQTPRKNILYIVEISKVHRPKWKERQL